MKRKKSDTEKWMSPCIRRVGFTLLEIIIATTAFFVIMTVIVNIYTKMIRIKYNIQWRINVIQEAYFGIEKLNLMLKDYTIDYEEYFNRKNIGCNNRYSTGFRRDVSTGWYCSRFTAYGNNNSISPAPSWQHKIYFCSSMTGQDITYRPYKVIKETNVQNGSWCINTGKQSFGQYSRQFRDVKDDTDSISGARNDDDDENVMKGPTAIDNATGIQELYLISQDGKSRIFMRRKLIASGDWNGDGTTWNFDSEKLYSLQILRLRWFDAGSNHDFDINNSSGVYDGKIDTRACDYKQGFMCNGTGIGSVYSWYKLASWVDDGWVNLFQKSVTFSYRNLIIFPTKNPQYALAENNVQINPYFTINLTTKLYGQIRRKRLGMKDDEIDTFQIGVQTTFNTKNFYTK